MRVAGVQIFGHPGLGDLKVDFRGADGRAARQIVLAGENGCGKTALLEAIFAAISPPIVAQTMTNIKDSGRSIILIETDSPLFIPNGIAISPEYFEFFQRNWPDFMGFAIEINGPKTLGLNDNIQYFYHKFYDLTLNMTAPGGFDSTDLFRIPVPCFYSEALVSFEVPHINSITTLNGPNNNTQDQQRKVARAKSGSGLAGQIAQLLVDLQSADDGETAAWVKSHKTVPPDEEIDKRTKIFSEAFKRVVSNKTYVGFKTIDGQHKPVFKTGRFETPLGSLSTGEKQVIFRGAFLLRELANLPGSVVLIDEPELSLHPTWQARILDYYDEIVTETKDRRSQIIVATHSPYVVHGSPQARHIILRRDRSTGSPEADDAPSYPAVSPADVAVAAFDLTSLPSGNQAKKVGLIVEGERDRKLIELAWKKLRPKDSAPFAVIAAGGAKQLQQLLVDSNGTGGVLVGALADIGTKKVVGLWDFDAAGIPQWNGTVKAQAAERNGPNVAGLEARKRRGQPLWTALLPCPQHRIGYASSNKLLADQSCLTMELLFEDQYIEKLVSRVPLLASPEVTRLEAVSDADKDRVQRGAAKFPVEAFEPFKPIFELIELVVASD